jgi:uncharacterized membrane protein YeaQ/YmgE (transglycosylase-associated protein family)
MSIIAWVVIGGLAGWIASAILREREGCLMYVILGIVGAFIGGFLFSALGKAPMTGFNLYSLFVAVVGSLILIAIVRAVRGRR